MPRENVWGDFLSTSNFRLAWERVLRSSHSNTKDRIALRSFAAGLDDNLDRLLQAIDAGIYAPSMAPKMYLPKPARTLRTIPVLSVADRIVYQAIGNLVIKEASGDLSVMADRHVFAHLPQPDESQFVLRRWQEQRQAFIETYERIWGQGYRWVVEADVAAFYASIDHRLLLELVRKRWISDERLLELILACLHCWTAHDGGSRLNSGVPQGYETSDVLSTLFLLPVDETMVQSFRYLRYVDDIRVLTHDRDTASKALVTLDLALKARALILQTKKTVLREVETLEGESGTLARRLSQITVRQSLGKDQQDELKEAFFQAWHRLDEKPEEADSALAFGLYRLDADTTIRNIAIQLLDILPWRSSIINYYLEKFPDDDVVAQALVKHLVQHKVYAWHLANCMRTLGKLANPNLYRGIALSWIRNRDLRWFQRVAAVEALQQDEESHAAMHAAISGEDNSIVKRSLIVSCAAQADQAGSDQELASLIRRSLEDECTEVKLVGIWLLQQFSRISWDAIGFTGSLGPLQPLVPELNGRGVETPCFIKHTLRTVYGVQVAESLNFARVFGDYTGAVRDMRKAVPYYYTDPSLYVGLINSFNHRVAIALKSVVGSTIPNDQYDNMLRSTEFKTNVPQVSLYFARCNAIRNQMSGFHPYASALGTWARVASHHEKEQLHKGLKLAYQEFVTEYERHAGITVR